MKRLIIIFIISLPLTISIIVILGSGKLFIDNMLYLLIIIFALMAVFLISGLIGKKIKKDYDASFRNVLANLNVRYESFYNKPFACGTYKDHLIYFCYIPVAKNELMPISTSAVILCGMKIPSTENRRIHLAVFSNTAPSKIREIFGWQNPEPGFFLASIRGQTIDISRQLFLKLSRGAKDRMTRIARHFGSCTLVPDQLTIIIGTKNASKLFGNTAPLSLLELQVKIPFNSGREELPFTLDSLVEVADIISADLKESH